MTFENGERTERRLEGHTGRRTRRVLLVFLGVSVALHAAVLGLLPDFSRDPVPSITALEVVLLKTDAVVVASPAPMSPRRRQPPEPERVVAPVEPRPAAPAPAQTEPQAREGDSFTIEPSRSAEPAVAAPEQKTQLAGVAVTLPSLNAAYLRTPAPLYPASARRAGAQGTVMLRVQVTREGLVARADIEKSSGSPHLDAAALEAVKAWRFVPARQGAEPIESRMLVPIVFRIEGPG